MLVVVPLFVISIHALFAEGDICHIVGCKRPCPISIHALFAEGDRSCAAGALPQEYFYPRPLRRGRPGVLALGYALAISIHALFAEGDQGNQDALRRFYCISIHALFAEGDISSPAFAADVKISIHALFAEGDTSRIYRGSPQKRFLSTPSSQRATQLHAIGIMNIIISIHALFAEGDLVEFKTDFPEG